MNCLKPLLYHKTCTLYHFSSLEKSVDENSWDSHGFSHTLLNPMNELVEDAFRRLIEAAQVVDEQPDQRAKKAERETKQIGRLIRDFRKALGLDVKSFSALLEVSEKTVYRWERENEMPSIIQLQDWGEMANRHAKSPQAANRGRSGTEDLDFLAKDADRPLGLFDLRGMFSHLQEAERAIFLCGVESSNFHAQPEFRQRLLAQLANPDGPEFHFIFMAEKIMEPGFETILGRASFESHRRFLSGLQGHLSEEPGGNLDRLKMYVIDDSILAAQFGLGIGDTTRLVLEYDDRREHAVGIAVDLFIGMPVASYDRDAAGALHPAASLDNYWLQLGDWSNTVHTKDYWRETMGRFKEHLKPITDQ